MLKVPLNRAGKGLLKRFHRLPARAKVTLTNGVTQTSHSKRVTFKLRSRKH